MKATVSKEALVSNTSHLKTLWEKEKLLATSYFTFSNSVFYSFGELSSIFVKFEIVSVLKSLKFVVWERVDRQFSMAQMMESVFNRIDYIIRKGGHGCYQYLLNFPHCFPEASFSGMVKTWNFAVKS